MTVRPISRGRRLRYYLSLLPLALRGSVFFILRGRLPRLVLMDRGARIRGLRNVRFAGAAKIGAYATLDARDCVGVAVGKGFSLGDFSVLRCSGSPAFLCPGVNIGEGVTFGPYCNIGGGYGLVIGEWNIFGPYVSLHPETHVTDDRDRPIREQGVHGTGIEIGPDNWFGAKATVLDGALVGSGNIIAAGALLLKGAYGSGAVWGGVPARKLAERS